MRIHVSKIIPQKYFPVFTLVRIQAPHAFAQKLIPQDFFPACIGFVPGGIVNAFQDASEDICVRLSRVGVGRAPCEGVSEIQFCRQRGTIWKTQHLRRMTLHMIKKMRTACFRRTSLRSPFGGRDAGTNVADCIFSAIPGCS